MNLPIVGVGFLGITFFLKLSHRKSSLMAKLRGLDYVGSGLFITSITAFLIPVTWGGVQYAWDSWHTLVPLILGAFGLVAFGIYEASVASITLIPMFIFSNWTTCILYVGSCFHGLILYALVYYMPEYFQAVQSYSPIISGVAALPQTVTVVPCAVIVGVVVGITGKYRWAIWAGWFLTTFGCGLLIKLDVNTSIAAWIFLEAVSGLGIGLLFPSIALAIQSSIPQTEVAMAATLVLFFRSFGQALGVAIGGTILDNRMRVNLQKITGLPQGSESYAIGTVALVEQLKAMPSDSPLAFALRNAFASSFRTIWAVMCGFAGLNLIAHFLIKEYDMNQEHLTEQYFIQERHEQGNSTVNNTNSELQLIEHEDGSGTGVHLHSMEARR
jgi:Fungal trichothecene efflux pump (TRI12)